MLRRSSRLYHCGLARSKHRTATLLSPQPRCLLNGGLRVCTASSSSSGVVAGIGGIGVRSFGAALRESRRGAKSRSLPADDPFGERSSWEDPSDGVYAAWKDVDQEGFVTAAESEEVRRAHFGPEWSRFTTVGRLSVKKMQEDPRHKTRAEGDPSAYPTAEETHERELAHKQKIMTHNYGTYEEFLAGEMGGGNAHGETDDDFFSSSSDPVCGDSNGAAAVSRSAATDDGNRREGGGGYQSSGEYALDQQGGRVMTSPQASTASSSSSAAGSTTATMHAEAYMEGEFSAWEGLDGHDRMAISRNPAREALVEAEAADGGGEGDGGETELPAFMQRDPTGHSLPPLSSSGGGGSDGAMATDGSTAAAASGAFVDPLDGNTEAHLLAVSMAATNASKFSTDGGSSSGRGGGRNSGSNVGVPQEILRPRRIAPVSSSSSAAPVTAAFAAAVLARLPGHHGDPAIPLVDPVQWNTEHVLRFLQLFENTATEAGGDTTTLDESMLDAFRLAGVDGELLLNVVTPPRLFRVLRRWHVRRQEVVTDCWRRGNLTPSDGGGGGGAREDPVLDEVYVTAAVAKAAPKLEEAVFPVTPLIIQETILLCFPYAR